MKLIFAALLSTQIISDVVRSGDLREVRRAVEDFAAGRPAPGELTPTIQLHFLKAKTGNAFVSMMLFLPSATDGVEMVEIYVRGVSEATGRSDVQELEPVHGRQAYRPSMRTFPIEGGSTVRVEPESGGRVRARFAFAAPAGRFVIYGAVRERTTHKPRSGVFTKIIDVPDFTTVHFTASSLILSDRLDAYRPTSKTPPPYTFGNIVAVPAFGRLFSPRGSVSVLLLLYHARADSSGNPDVTVEFRFYAVRAAIDEPFARPRLQELNATTLAAGFNLLKGDQLVAGQELPLATFPPGEYRVEARATDRISGEIAIVRETFTVQSPN
jgi:hypothetical protein